MTTTRAVGSICRACGSTPERVETWRTIKALYRRGDLAGLAEIQETLRAAGVAESWPVDPACVRRECERVRRVRGRVDRRLDAMCRRFPFNRRDQLVQPVSDAVGGNRILPG